MQVQLQAALVKAQSEMGAVFKDSTNPHYRSKYASLPAVLHVVIPALNRNGIAFSQSPDYDPDTSCVVLTTSIAHSGGGVYETVTRAPIGRKVDIQSFGSAVTYLRRYAAQSLLGISVEDDDGNAAARRKPPVDAECRYRALVAATIAAQSPALPWSTRIARQLQSSGLTAADFNTWAAGAGKPLLGDMTDAQKANVYAWLDQNKGGAVIRAAIGGEQ